MTPMTRAPFLPLLLLLAAPCLAQRNTTASGGEATGGGTVSYSVGQPAYTAVAGTGGTVQQGVQQAYTVLPTALNPGPDGQLLLTAFPNPASDLITVHANTILSPDAIAQVVAADGNLVLQQRLTGVDNQLDLQALAAGSYTLSVLDHDRVLGRFTLIKH